MTSTVKITADAEASIREQARYIAIDEQAPLNAARWLERVYAATDSLDKWPRRCAIADEDRYRPYEIRKLGIDGYLLLFTIVDETNTVWVIATRHGRQQPQPDDLPAGDRVE